MVLDDSEELCVTHSVGSFCVCVCYSTDRSTFKGSCVYLRAGRWAASVQEQHVFCLIDVVAILAYVGEISLSTVIATAYRLSSEPRPGPEKSDRD